MASFSTLDASTRMDQLEKQINMKEGELEQLNPEEEASRALLSRLSKHLTSFGLSPFSAQVAIGYMQSRLQEDGGAERFARVTEYFVDKLGGGSRAKAKKASCSTSTEEIGIEKNWQAGCPNLFPSLKATPIWDTSGFPWVQSLEEAFPLIRDEFFELKGKNAFQPYRAPVSDSNKNEKDVLGQLATDRGAWNVSYLYLHGLDYSENLKLCPKTSESISNIIPRHYSHAFFSALAPCSHITAHYGPTNKKLRCHLPLVVPRNDKGKSCAWLRVADQKVYLEEGKPVLFDDSFEHEAGNDAEEVPRVVLVMDMWHPNFSDEEVKFLDFMNKAQVNAAKRLAKEGGGAFIAGDFLSVISRAGKEAGDEPAGDIWPYNVVND